MRQNGGRKGMESRRLGPPAMLQELSSMDRITQLQDEIQNARPPSLSPSYDSLTVFVRTAPLAPHHHVPQHRLPYLPRQLYASLYRDPHHQAAQPGQSRSARRFRR